MTRGLARAFLLAAGSACAVPAPAAPAADSAPAPAPARVMVLSPLDDAAGRHVDVIGSGLDPGRVEAFVASRPDRAAWQALLSLRLVPGAGAGGEGAPAGGLPPMAGDYSADAGSGMVYFKPRFPLEPASVYRAQLDPGALPPPSPSPAPAAAATDPAPLVVFDYAVPARPERPPVTVAAVYPSADILPQNQLKFYLHFSAPMSRGYAYRHLRLLDAGGSEVDLPFLELDEELWDPDSLRLTLFFDPGRVKRGLVPREVEGPVLREGERYTLVVDAAFPDATGRPLARTHRKVFRVGEPDFASPEPGRWVVAAPLAGTRGPLEVALDEPLDHALLNRLVSVVMPSGGHLDGAVEIAGGETVWRFVPSAPWVAGEHQIEVVTTLEDLAGNSVARPFETSLAESDRPSPPPKVVRVPFRVGAPETPSRRASRLPENCWVLPDLPYAATDNPRQRLDLVLPVKRADAAGPLPVLVFVHGGAWRKGDKRTGLRRVAEFVRTGRFVGVSAGYRLSGEAVWPAQLHDVKAAVRWVRANAAKYDLDPQRIGVWGTSAGGHLVACLGVTGDVPELEGDLGPHRDESSAVACVVNFFGPTELLAMSSQPSTIDHDAAGSPESQLVGGALPEHPEKARAASPISYVGAGDPPVLTLHGTEDALVPFDQGVRFHAALEKAGVEHTFVHVVGAGHGFGGPEVDARVRAFLEKHLLGRDTAVSADPIKASPRRRRAR